MRRRRTVLAVTASLLLAPLAPAATGADGPTGLEQIIAGMTLEEKVGQMFVPYMYGSTVDEADPRNVPAAGVESIGEMIEEFHPGGIIYFGWSNSLDSPEQVARLSNDIQQRATADGGVPMTTSIDQEEGVVLRLPQPSAQLPGAMALGATRDAGHARDAARITAEKLAAVGVNQNYSPIVDVNSNALNPVIGVRALGGDTALVADLGSAQVRGFQDDGGISASVKHFPGHGDTDVDSHFGVPLIDKSEAEFRAEDLPPFQAAIDAGADSVMTAHIVVPALDPSGRPATFSYPILTELLREEMGFDGVVVTDSLSMEGAREEFGDDRVPVEAILAGADQMLMPPNLRVAYDGVMAAVADGEITEERIDASVRRILRQKAERGVLADPFVDVGAVPGVMATPEHHATAAQIADDSVTLLTNADGLLPLAEDTRVLLTGWGGAARLDTMAGALTEHGARVTVHPASEPTAAEIEATVTAAAGHDVVVLITQSAGFTPSDPQQDLAAALAGTAVPVAQVAVRNPYDAATLAPAEASLAVYGYADVSLAATARALMGEVNPAGLLPVAVPTASGDATLFPLGHGRHYPVTPLPPEFIDRPGRGQDAYTLPAVQGVDYVVRDRVRAPGTYRTNRNLTVRAVAADGYELAAGAPAEWRSEFSTGLPDRGEPPWRPGRPGGPR